MRGRLCTTESAEITEKSNSILVQALRAVTPSGSPQSCHDHHSPRRMKTSPPRYQATKALKVFISEQSAEIMEKIIPVGAKQS